MSKKFDLLSIGAWAIYDHLYKLSIYPQNGDTVTLDMPIEALERVYYGDCSANIAAVAAKLGVSSALAMVVGEDFSSSGYKKHLSGLGVDISAVEVRVGQRSGHNYLYFDSNGDGFCISHQGVAAVQSSWVIPENQIRQATYVVINEKFSEYTLASAHLAKQSGANVVLNGMVASAGNLAIEFIQLADILFIAESELSNLLTILNLSSPVQLVQKYLKVVFATQGKKGSLVYTPNAVIPVAPVLVEDVVDTTGAGDGFAAGTLAALIKGFSPSEAAQIGATVSSFVIQAWGCQTNLPAWDEMMQRLNKYKEQDR